MLIGQTILYEGKEYKIVKKTMCEDLTPYYDIQRGGEILKDILEFKLKKIC